MFDEFEQFEFSIVRDYETISIQTPKKKLVTKNDSYNKVKKSTQDTRSIPVQLNINHVCKRYTKNSLA